MSSFCGYHGTCEESAKLILPKNFKQSTSEGMHLGPAFYFFIDGLMADGRVSASRWARHFHKPNKPAVVGACVDCTDANLLDLRLEEHIKLFNTLKTAFLLRLEKAERLGEEFPKRRNRSHDIGKIASAVIKFSETDAVVLPEYCKVVGEDIENKLELGLDCKVPNCLILGVVNTALIGEAKLYDLDFGTVNN